ncbi:hypothetical protein [Bacillus sp. SG-1]|uniref:hypothetical protein n=1 Tax=Bacillus sp. SG-1 TaxID=161544 RepID=UPI0001543E85|nr:hypothetical protein [Bacillus sp. SG-1]EDL64999.1 hypothetical protein BSG1_14799 [Bacillus sp. SG-1]
MKFDNGKAPFHDIAEGYKKDGHEDTKKQIQDTEKNNISQTDRLRKLDVDSLNPMQLLMLGFDDLAQKKIKESTYNEIENR